MLLLLSQWTVKSGASSVAAALMFLFGNLVDDPTTTTTASEVRSTAAVESASGMQCKRLTVSACNAALQRVTPAPPLQAAAAVLLNRMQTAAGMATSLKYILDIVMIHTDSLQLRNNIFSRTFS